MNEFDENNNFSENTQGNADNTTSDSSGSERNVNNQQGDENNRSNPGTYHYTGSETHQDYPGQTPPYNAAPNQQGNSQQYYNQPPYNNSGNGSYRPPEYNAPGNNNVPPHYSNPYPYAGQNNYAYPPQSPNGSQPPKKRRGGVIVGAIAGLLCLAVVVTVVVYAVTGGIGKKTTTPNNSIDNVDEVTTGASAIAEAVTGENGELAAKAIFKQVQSSSVGVLVYDSSKSLSSEGSGVIFSEDNDGVYTYIATCAHVISDSGVNIMVQLYDNTEYQAQVVGYDTKTDIGVLRIKAHGLSIASIGDSSVLEVGDTVYAIGNPGGTEFANSFTAGIISAIDRPVSSSSTGYTMECIQHTAAINPGNSGGALVNSFGQVIGINSMKIVASEYEGMGFAVPSSVFTSTVNEIIANGYVTNRPKLGITYVPASKYQSYSMFVAIKGLPAGSIVVYSISDDSSLAGTKVQKGDMIVAVNGTDLGDSSYLPELIENSSVGDKLTLSMVRINDDYTYEEFTVEVTLVEDKGDTTLSDSSSQEETTTGSNPGNYFNPFG